MTNRTVDVWVCTDYKWTPVARRASAQQARYNIIPTLGNAEWMLCHPTSGEQRGKPIERSRAPEYHPTPFDRSYR